MSNPAPSAPSVSVIIRTQNRPDTLAYALHSCLAQTYRPLELVVVNDGGCDVSSVLDGVREEAPEETIKIHTLVNDLAAGRARAGNQGLDAATGDFLIFLDDDDWFDPPHVAALVAALEQHPDCAAAYAGARFCVSPAGAELHRFEARFDPVRLRLENLLPIHAVLFRRQLLNLGCRLDEALEVYEDWDFWLQCARHTDFFQVDQVSAGYRAGGDSTAGWGQSESRMALARQALLAKWVHLWTPEQLDQALRWNTAAVRVLEQSRGRVMEDHKVLHEAHGALQKTYEALCDDYRQLNETSQATCQTLKAESQALQARNQVLQEQYRHLHVEYLELGRSFQAILDSTIWKATRPLRQAKQAVLAGLHRLGCLPGRRGEVGQAFAMLYRSSGGLAPLLAKILFRLRQEGLTATWRRVRYHIRRQQAAASPVALHWAPEGPPYVPTAEAMARLPDERIGIMAHVFFVELFPELCGYVGHVPLPLQLLVSVTSEEARAAVLAERHLLGERVDLRVKIVPNRGRDIAPLLLAFREEMMELDLLLHVHTKKSSYIASPLFGEHWRRYLLDGLLGSEARVRAILAQFAADAGVGMIYPETYPGLPYWAHSWLSNRAQAEALLARLGFSQVDFAQYIPYPAGSMFWARVAALRPLLDLGLTWADFPEEQGQTDQTLHHALERCLVFGARAAGLTERLLFQSQGRDAFRRTSPALLQQYLAHPLAERFAVMSAGAAVISFDIFDTLLWRPLARPEAVHWMLEERLARDWGIQDFTRLRHQAEARVRHRLAGQGDVTIADIYRELSAWQGWDVELASRLQDLEVTTEQTLLRVNPLMAAIVRGLGASQRRWVLVSDMYLGSRELEPVLRRLGLDGYGRFYGSADTGRRKDRGDVWPHVLEQEGIDQDQLLHVGDHEQVDIQWLVDRQFRAPVHILKPITLLGLLPGGEALIEVMRHQPSWRNELILGLIANRLHVQIHEHPDQAGQPLSVPEVFGYGVVGPILAIFMAWLLPRVRQNGVSSVRFLSREGWLFDQVYQSIVQHPALAGSDGPWPTGGYYYASRSSLALAAVEQESDLESLLGAHYRGSLRQLFTARLGLSDLTAVTDRLGAERLETHVLLPEDYVRVKDALHQCWPALREEGQRQRAAFRGYDAAWITAPDPHPALVDIGYSGTIQLAMMKATGQPLRGYYLVTNASCGRVLEQGGSCASCFGHLLALEAMDQHPLHRYSLLLEAVLTSPEGQLQGFELHQERWRPLFKEPGAAQRHFDQLALIHQGARAFVHDVLDVLGAHFLEPGWDAQAAGQLLPLIVQRQLPIGALETVLTVEDQYCGNQELSVLDFYARLQR